MRTRAPNQQMEGECPLEMKTWSQIVRASGGICSVLKGKAGRQRKNDDVGGDSPLPVPASDSLCDLGRDPASLFSVYPKEPCFLKCEGWVTRPGPQSHQLPRGESDSF